MGLFFLFYKYYIIYFFKNQICDIFVLAEALRIELNPRVLETPALAVTLRPMAPPLRNRTKIWRVRASRANHYTIGEYKRAKLFSLLLYYTKKFIECQNSASRASTACNAISYASKASS